MTAARQHGMPVAFVDFFATLAVIMFVLFAISSVQDPKKANDPAVVPKAEFLIVMSWDDGSQDDLDLYVRTPDGKVVFFANRQEPGAFLDQDNLGRNNTLVMPDGTAKEVPARNETVTIRAIMPGTYQVNAHLYSKRSAPGYVNHVTVKATKLNPFSDVTQAQAEFDTQGQERTLFNFTVAADGRVTDVFMAPSKLVGSKG